MKGEVAKLRTTLDGFRDEIPILDSLASDLRLGLEMLGKRMEGVEARLAEELPMPTAGTQAAVSVAVPLSAATFDSLYELGQAYFEEGRYLEAVPLFERLVISNPDDDRADNAQYWTGECYYGAKDYSRAIVEFEKVFTFARTNKEDDAQIMLGNCYLRLGDRNRAAVEFARLVRYYPNSEYLELARSRLE